MNKRFDDLCCVIVSYNCEHNIEKQIQNLCDNLHLIVVDNGSNQESINFLKSLKEKYDFILVLNEENIGLSKALNQGIDFAKRIGSKYLLTLDQDSFFDIENVEKMINCIDIEKRVVSVGPCYDENIKENTNVNFLITSGNIVLLSIFDELGKFDENLFIDQIDIEFSFRLLVNNYQMMMVKDTKMIHKIGELERSYIFKIKYLSHSPKRFYYMYRNERYLLRKYRSKLRWLCFKSYLASMLGVLKVIFIERNKTAKLKQIIKGNRDGKKIAIE